MKLFAKLFFYILVLIPIIMADEKLTKYKNIPLLPFRNRIKLFVAGDNNGLNAEELKLLNLALNGNEFTEIEIEHFIKNENKLYNRYTISAFLSTILERDIYSNKYLPLINLYINHYNDIPLIFSLYLVERNNLYSKAPAFWLAPCITFLVNGSIEALKRSLLSNQNEVDMIRTHVIRWCAMQKKAVDYSIFFLNLPFLENVFPKMVQNMNCNFAKSFFYLKEEENYDSLFDWYYEKIIVPAKLELEWFEKLEEKEKQIKLALKSKEKFFKKEKEMFLEKQNEILKLRENKK